MAEPELWMTAGTNEIATGWLSPMGEDYKVLVRRVSFDEMVERGADEMVKIKQDARLHDLGAKSQARVRADAGRVLRAALGGEHLMARGL